MSKFFFKISLKDFFKDIFVTLSNMQLIIARGPLENVCLEYIQSTHVNRGTLKTQKCG